MPIYEYGCEACGHRFEVQQKLSEAPLKKCPECGKKTLEKLISPTAFVLKGSGWYKDGYGGKSSGRSDNQRSDRLQKAINDDKKKPGGSSDSGSSSGGGTPAPSTSGGGGGDAGGGKSSAASDAA